MIYTEEDLEQAYAIGYNEAVDDVNEYIDQESMEFSLDESYDEDYSAVEDAIMESIERGSPEWVKRKHVSNSIRIANKAGVDPKKLTTATGLKDLSPNEKINLRKEIRKNGFYNGGLAKAKEKYNAYHARKGDCKRWLD